MDHDTGSPMLGSSPAFGAMLEQVSRLAPLDRPALILGERGTGKELVAARLHYLSPRWEQPLVKLNCAALTESLLESELFGHEAGAFTGATRRHTGRFERADGGSLFLDELGTLPARMQEKILRVIEYGEFERVGGSETLQVDVRILGATNEDLPAAAREGRFRADLLDRLAFDVVHVPPLRARPEDVLELAEHFAVAFTAELRRPFFPGLSERAVEALLAWPWPGNVRELKNAVERSIYRASDPAQPLEEIHFDPFATPHAPAPDAAAPDEAAGELPPGSALPLDFRAEVDRFEQRLVLRALNAADGNRRVAAESLGLTYDQLRGLLRKHGVGGPGRPGRPPA
ncbi:phage shock protein operon transcriptional activator [Thioalkalivibrio sp. XN8]|uniref:phage shock protein operon transcriptional activator n=1 Tax=Thioalkalivibrio sp. XN8 TaxID=2712863 RepID=UPI0013EB1B60|nr:phage shock protein operon transcriptional activator [Thioalkalivibrio sp. XN8]NGP52576.1 phage shock protein operon transcriptional activator [Thioalkalivibrio sp. XN8]